MRSKLCKRFIPRFFYQGITVIWNISENKEDFRNILDKVKYLGPNIHINSLILTRFSKIHFFVNKQFSILSWIGPLNKVKMKRIVQINELIMPCILT